MFPITQPRKAETLGFISLLLQIAGSLLCPGFAADPETLSLSLSVSLSLPGKWRLTTNPLVSLLGDGDDDGEFH